MTAGQLWTQFQNKTGISHESYAAWQFGSDADGLAALVKSGEKRATSSLYCMYERENEPLPMVGEYNVILDSREQAVCITKTVGVEILPYGKVSAQYAALEGEGDKSLAHWREVHRAFFEQELKETALAFDEETEVVFEQFICVYTADEGGK